MSRPVLLAASLLLLQCSTAPGGRIHPEARAAAIERRLSSMRLDTVTVIGMTTEGAELTGHFERDSLRRLSAVWLGEMGQGHERFYFDQRGLFLVEQIELTYGSPVGYDSSNAGQVVRAETTVTILEDTMARGWQATARARRVFTPAEATARANRLKVWADSLVRLLRKPSPYYAR